MGPIQQLAADLGVQERTLRRAAAQGALRCRRTRPRTLRLAPGEGEYLEGHWQLLSQLRRTLRTQRTVRLAVLYGSMARGEEDEDSDLDLLVSFDRGNPADSARLAARLDRVTGRRVDVADLARVDLDAPLLLDRVLDEGRVIVDRDGEWRRLQDRRRAIRARGQRAFRRQMDGAAHAIAELTGG